MNNSCVYLVGAGPGDPELLTVKALRLIQTADVVVYDRLITDEIIGLIPAGVVKIYAGKESGRHALPQYEINDLLVSLARNKKHRRIVRLKGGDPFMFGRGSEEALVLAENQVRYEIVPGITSAMACSAYAGVPLTHRGLANEVSFIAGHRRADQTLKLDQSALQNKDCTLVIYMGIGNLEPIVDAVLAAGRPAETPVAVIEQGTTSRQRRLISNLSNLVVDTREAWILPPAMIVIGEVVSLADTLDWFVPAVDQQKQSADWAVPR